MSKLHYEAAMSAPPSGRQIEISSGEQRATIVELGGALRSYTVGSRERIEGYDRDEMCSGSRGQPLVPWPNRIAAGSYEFGGAPPARAERTRARQRDTRARALGELDGG